MKGSTNIDAVASKKKSDIVSPDYKNVPRA